MTIHSDKEPATEKQLKMLWRLQLELGSEPKWFDDMPKSAARELISQLIERRDELEKTGNSYRNVGVWYRAVQPLRDS